MPTYYELLGVSPSATVDEIQERFDDVALQLIKSTAAGSDTKLKQIKEARLVLTDPAQRAGYDAALRSLGMSEGSVVNPAPPPPAPDLDRTLDLDQAIDLERTQPVAPPPRQAPRREAPPLVEHNPQEDRRLAAELTRRGISPDEVKRLVDLGAGVTKKPSGKTAVAMPTAPELPPSQAVQIHPTITLPEFREASTSDKEEAGRYLSSAGLAFRRGRLGEARDECRKAIEADPSDAAALELYGDIYQGLGRVDDALYAYQRAIDSTGRPTAEKKYAELMLMQNKEIELLRGEFIPRNPNISVFLSALVPGAGQLYNGEIVKGGILLAISLSMFFLLGWTQLGFSGARASIPPSLMGLSFLSVIAYVYALIDAKRGANRSPSGSGWDV
jgi:tetratricopeptide (TPR) repeat protein